MPKRQRPTRWRWDGRHDDQLLDLGAATRAHCGESRRRAQPALDAGRGVHRDGAVAVQRHCAQRRAAVHRGRSAALVHLAAVGAVQLRARAGEPAARGWRAGRPVRAQAPVPRGPRRLRRRLRCRRARGLGRGVDRGALRAGHRCGSDISRRAGAPRRRVRRRGAGPRDRHLGCHHLRGDRAGTARRRRARGGVVLACELSRGARPGRADRRDGRATRARIACPGRTGARHRGDGRADRGDVSVGLRVARGQPARLGLGAGRGRRAGRGRGVRRVRRRRAPRRPAADRACADAQPDLRRGDARRARVRRLLPSARSSSSPSC